MDSTSRNCWANRPSQLFHETAGHVEGPQPAGGPTIHTSRSFPYPDPSTVCFENDTATQNFNMFHPYQLPSQPAYPAEPPRTASTYSGQPLYFPHEQAVHPPPSPGPNPESGSTQPPPTAAPGFQISPQPQEGSGSPSSPIPENQEPLIHYPTLTVWGRDEMATSADPSYRTIPSKRRTRAPHVGPVSRLCKTGN